MPSIKQLLRQRLNRVLEPIGFQLVRFTPEVTSRRMLSPWVRAQQIQKWRGAFVNNLMRFPELSTRVPSAEEIGEFLERLQNVCPVRQQSGGGGVSTALLLWTLVKCVQPREIVESGVYRGFTTWVFAQANPAANVLCCDLSFDELRWKHQGASYHQKDWASVVDIARKNRTESLVFFDDHVNQWRRLDEAAARGFRYAIFDDAYPIEALHYDGEAAYPTIPMLFDDRLHDEAGINWLTESGGFSYVHESTLQTELRSKVRKWTCFSSTSLTLGFQPAQIALVEIVS